MNESYKLMNENCKLKELLENPNQISELPHKIAVAMFRLVTGHDCLGKHLHRIGIFPTPHCPLCPNHEEMYMEHLKHSAMSTGSQIQMAPQATVNSGQPVHSQDSNMSTVFLYGCETWTFTLREEQRLRVFENKVLRKIFVAERDEVTGEWRKLHNAELHALYSSPDIIRNIKSRCLRWTGHVAHMGKSRNAYRVLVWRQREKDLWES
ncbi:hypothetical protein ANN_19836 [Periplaneta americana]|uniref:Uncharacterized protein n=1 Tax=Periplaneta americana TaxID=6978 RepID=A0ABQ8SBJ6_PERAM|nr:hypothetical protein ANN_19836 [Periplaneta americana]